MFYAVLLFVSCLLFIRLKRRGHVVAFFHPYCNAGGGGERVLWCAIRAMQARFPSLSFVVYSGDEDATKEQILLRAKQRFGIEIAPESVSFVFLRWRRIVEAAWYPRFTLLCQTLAGGLLGLEALLRLTPSLMIDSMGYPLTLPIFRWLAGSSVAAYVHYPTISTDMISLVERRERSFNNADAIASSGILSTAKLWYYRAFAWAYGMTGRAADVVMVNGSWTRGHISSIWGGSPRVVFPPCDIQSFLSLPVLSEERLKDEKELSMLSIGQIRPEKNHRLQLKVLKGVIEMVEENALGLKVCLVIAGGCRHADDEQRVRDLKEMAKDLGVDGNIRWMLNVPFDDMLNELSRSLISLHTMSNEHFGISVVEGVASGTVMLAHKSAGPLMDIVTPADGENRVGFLAETEQEYVDAVRQIVSMSRADRDALRALARASVTRFSEEEFDVQWTEAIKPLLPL